MPPDRRLLRRRLETIMSGVLAQAKIEAARVSAETGISVAEAEVALLYAIEREIRTTCDAADHVAVS
ncbi:MAG: hypothetical protein RIC82_08010 [Parvibaculum sp.]